MDVKYETKEMATIAKVLKDILDETGSSVEFEICPKNRLHLGVNRIMSDAIPRIAKEIIGRGHEMDIHALENTVVIIVCGVQ